MLPRPGARTALDVARRRLVAAARRRSPWLRTAPIVPRPRRAARRRLELGVALTASDLHPSYLALWPLARRAWRELVGLDTLLVLVADDAEVPPELRDDPDVRIVPPVDGLHTAFQAQCIRLLYPALVETDAAVLVTDVDMIPLSATYFHRPPSRVDARDFVAYRDVLVPVAQVPICYNAALPITWRDAFGISTPADIAATLERWGAGIEYAGERGATGWDTDQEVLYRRLVKWAAETRRVWVLDDASTGFNRLERAELRKPRTLTTAQRRALLRGRYTDYHALPAEPAFEELNDEVFSLARKAAG